MGKVKGELRGSKFEVRIARFELRGSNYELRSSKGEDLGVYNNRAEQKSRPNKVL